MSWLTGEYLKVWINWSGDRNFMRSSIVAGMQLEVYKKSPEEIKYSMTDDRWRYKLLDSTGEEICWGMARTKAQIKNYALAALKRRMGNRE